MLRGLKQGLGVQEVGAEATPGVPSTAWADGDHPETEQVHQDVTRLSQVRRVSEAAHLRFVKWQTVFLARGACPGRFLGGGGLPLRGDFSEIHLAGLSSASPTRKQRSKLRRGQSQQGHSLLHTAGTLEGLAAKHTSEKCDCHWQLHLLESVSVSTGLSGADRKDGRATAWLAFFKNVFY